MFESNDNTTKRIDVYSKYDIFEFDFDIIMNKLNYSNQIEFTLGEIKKVLLYLTGKKKSKKEILAALQMLRPNEKLSDENIISKNNLKILFDYYRNENEEEHLINSLYDYLSTNNIKRKISIDDFISKVKLLKPNLTTELIAQLFIFISESSTEISYNSLKSTISLLNKEYTITIYLY